MSWCPFVPIDPSPTFGQIVPTAGVLHRTSNSQVHDDWGGAYAVGTQGTFHFLVGLHDGQVVQFGRTDERMWHAYGANDWSFGVEFVGQNGSPLTAWQLKTGGAIIEWAAQTHGIPLTYYDGPRVNAWAGFLNHRNVDAAAAGRPDFTHHDYVTDAEWQTMTAGGFLMALTDDEQRGIYFVAQLLADGLASNGRDFASTALGQAIAGIAAGSGLSEAQVRIIVREELDATKLGA